MTAIFGGVSNAEDAELDGYGLFKSQWGYGDPAKASCPDIWDLLDINKLLKLTNEGEKNIEKFHSMRYTYRLGVARLPCILLRKIFIGISPSV